MFEILKKFKFYFILFKIKKIYMFLYYFDILMSKIILKK